MTQKPKIPMLPEEVLQQRLTLVVDLPSRPEGFLGECAYVRPMPDKARPRGSPRNTTFVGAVEWASGPKDTRFDAYYINPRRSHWLLWNYWQDENDWQLRWCWSLYAYGPRRGVDEKTAAVYLLFDAWRSEAQNLGLKRYFLLDEPGLLSTNEITQIARLVWPAVSQQRQSLPITP